MPQLRSGARRSKRIGELQQNQPTAELNEVENVVVAGGGRGRGRKTGGGRGRGNAGVGKGRATGGGRGRGIKLIDLDPEPEPEAKVPCEILRNVGGVGVEPVVNVGVGMEGASGDKIMGTEDEGNATPVPDRV